MGQVSCCCWIKPSNKVGAEKPKVLAHPYNLQLLTQDLQLGTHIAPSIAQCQHLLVASVKGARTSL